MVTKPAGRQQTPSTNTSPPKAQKLHRNRAQLNPAATQQPSPRTNSLVLQREFSGRQSRHGEGPFPTHYQPSGHCPCMADCITSLPFLPFQALRVCSQPRHINCQRGRHQHPTSSGLWSLETISVNMSHCLHTKWEYSGDILLCVSKNALLYKKNLLYSSTYFSD